MSNRVIVFTIIILFADIGLGQSQNFNIPNGNDACSSISDHTVRARCYETSKVFGNQTNAQGTTLPGGWRLVRTPNPHGGVDAISISHSAEVLKSDPNLAGMILRCVEGQVEVLMVVLEPYPPLARIDLTIGLGNGQTSTSPTSVVPPGVMVRLPAEAATFILEDRGQPDELSVSMAFGTGSITAGTVKLTGLEQALRTLRTLCTAS